VSLQSFDRLALRPLEEWLDAFPPDAVRLLAVAGSDELPGHSIDWLATWTPVVVHAPRESDLDVLLSRIVEGMASLAGLAWPHWYRRRIPGFAARCGSEGILINDTRRADVVRSIPGVAPAWLERAISIASVGRPLVMRSVPFETQVEQMVLALDDPDLRLALVLPAETTASNLTGLARAAEWLRMHSGARVLVIVPGACHGQPGLDPISYGALCVEADELLADQASDFDAPVTQLHISIGKPHHASGAEQKLARALAAQPDLAKLFEFNGRLRTIRGDALTVDLLWREGKLIVEVDGWSTHGRREAFYADRHRDYELMLLDHRVLRITDDEITTDIAIVIEKIRDVVAFISKRGGGHEARKTL
jgi:very-short-patch-repair endonuclease